MSKFADQVKHIIEAAHLEPINILIWGSGDPGPDAPAVKRKEYSIRLKIREALTRKFPRAEVYLGDELKLLEVPEGIVSVTFMEAIYARAADLVIMFDFSRGTSLELDHFVMTYPWFRDKVFVFLPEKHVPPKGFVREVFDFLPHKQIASFSTKELREELPLVEKSVRIAESVAVAKLLQKY